MSKTTNNGYEATLGSEIIGAGEREASGPLPTSAAPDEASTLDAEKEPLPPPSSYMTNEAESRNNLPYQSYGIEDNYNWHRTPNRNKKKKKKRGTGDSGTLHNSQTRDANANNDPGPSTFGSYTPQHTLQMYSSPQPISGHIDSQTPLTTATARQNPAFTSQRLLQNRSNSLLPPQIANSPMYPSQTTPANFPQSAPQQYRPLPSSIQSPYFGPGRPVQPIPRSAYAQQQPSYPYTLPINPANVAQPTRDQTSDVFVASDPFRPHTHTKGEKEISSFDDIETPAPSSWKSSIPQTSTAAYESHPMQFASSSPFTNTITPAPPTPSPSNWDRWIYPSQTGGRHTEQSWNTPLVIPNRSSPDGVQASAYHSDSAAIPSWGSYPYYTSTNQNPWRDPPIVARPASPTPSSSEWARHSPYTSRTTLPVENNGYARPESTYKVTMPIPHIPMIVPVPFRPVSSEIGRLHHEFQPTKYTNGTTINESSVQHATPRPTSTAELSQETTATSEPILEPDDSSSNNHSLGNEDVIPLADSPKSHLSSFNSHLESTPILLPPSDSEGLSEPVEESMTEEITHAIDQNRPAVPGPGSIENHSPGPTTPDLYPNSPDHRIMPPREPWSGIEMPIPHIPLIVPPRPRSSTVHSSGSSINIPGPFPSVPPGYPPYPEGMPYGQGSTRPQPYSPWNMSSGYPYIPPQVNTKPSFWSNLKNSFHWPFRRHKTSSNRPQHTVTYIPAPPQPIYVTYTEDSKVDMTRIAVDFVTGTLPSQIYLHVLLRLPSLYFSRVARIFEEADLSLPEIKKMALETASTTKGQLDLYVVEPSNVPLQYTRLKSTWEGFIDSVMREWKTFNIISVLLLSAILTILQIESAADDPITRYTAISSLICALISLLFGCMYIIRFGSMRKTYKAAEWALEAKKTKTLIWWNVWVLLAMPAIWLTWSIVLYIACIMTFVWRTSSQSDTEPIVTSKTALLIVRVVISSVLGLGLVYGVLILNTFSRYGSVMDKAWKKRIDGWVVEKYVHTPHYSSIPHYHTPYTPYADASARRTPTTPFIPPLDTPYTPYLDASARRTPTTPFIPPFDTPIYSSQDLPATFMPSNFAPQTPFIPPAFGGFPYPAPMIPDFYPRSRPPGSPVNPYQNTVSFSAPFPNDIHHTPRSRADTMNARYATPASYPAEGLSPELQDQLHERGDYEAQHTNATDDATQSNTQHNSSENPTYATLTPLNLRPSSTHSTLSSEPPHGHLYKRPTLSVPPHPSLPPIPGTPGPTVGATDPSSSTNTTSPVTEARHSGLALVPEQRPENSANHVRFRSPVASAVESPEGDEEGHVHL